MSKTQTKTLHELVNKIPAENLAAAERYLKELAGIKDEKKPKCSVACIHCGGDHVICNGKSFGGRQRFICKDCGKSFTETSGSVTEYSHQDEDVWREVIEDTVAGISLADTANKLGISRMTVFRMRHKILCAVENAAEQAGIVLEGAIEADETYLLESFKGTPLPSGYFRKARRHGAVATKQGLSNEQICVCTSIGQGNKCYGVSVNRAAPSGEALLKVYKGKVTQETTIICDGNTTYDKLKSECTVAHTDKVNKVNGLHSYIKKMYQQARGVATKYLNRYLALYCEAYGKREDATQKICDIVTGRNGLFMTVDAIKVENLCSV